MYKVVTLWMDGSPSATASGSSTIYSATLMVEDDVTGSACLSVLGTNPSPNIPRGPFSG